MKHRQIAFLLPVLLCFCTLLSGCGTPSALSVTTPPATTPASPSPTPTATPSPTPSPTSEPVLSAPFDGKQVTLVGVWIDEEDGRLRVEFGGENIWDCIAIKANGLSIRYMSDVAVAGETLTANTINNSDNRLIFGFDTDQLPETAAIYVRENETVRAEFDAITKSVVE